MIISVLKQVVNWSPISRLRKFRIIFIIMFILWLFMYDLKNDCSGLLKNIHVYDHNQAFTKESHFGVNYPIWCWYAIKQMTEAKPNRQSHPCISQQKQQQQQRQKNVIFPDDKYLWYNRVFKALRVTKNRPYDICLWKWAHVFISHRAKRKMANTSALQASTTYNKQCGWIIDDSRFVLAAFMKLFISLSTRGIRMDEKTTYQQAMTVDVV